MVKMDWKYYFPLFVAILSLIVPIAIWRVDIRSKGVDVYVSNLLPLSPENKIGLDKLKISYGGLEVVDPYLVLLEIANVGSEPISKVDFEAPLRVEFGEGSKVLSVEVSETRPKGIPAEVNSKGNGLELAGLLLNPGDSLFLTVVTAGNRPEASVSARISGVKNVALVTEKKSFRSLMYGALLALLSVVAFFLYVYVGANLAVNRGLKTRRLIAWSIAVVLVFGAFSMASESANKFGADFYAAPISIQVIGCVLVLFVYFFFVVMLLRGKKSSLA